MIDNEEATLDANETQNTTPEVEQPKSMEDTIRETLRGLQDQGKGLEAAPSIPDSPEEKAEKIRDNKGKFAKPEVSAATGEAPADAANELLSEAPRVSPPNTWKKEAAAKFATLDPVVQEEIMRREANIHAGLEQYRGKAQFGDSIDKAIEPFKHTLNNLGVTPDVAIRELLSADHKLRYGTPQDKQAYFAQLAQSYGVDIGQLTAQENAYVDPTVAALQQQVQQLSGYVSSQQQRDQQQQFQAQQREADTLNSEIAAFSSDPKNRHFESVRGYMASLLQAGQAKDLNDAYEQAIYANPTTRAIVIAEQQAQARAEAAKKAQAARTASSVNVRSRPSMPVSQPIGTMDDTIRATLRRLQAA